MTRHYPVIWKQLQDVKRFDKYASASSDAAVDLARVCNDVFDSFQEKAAEYGVPVSADGAARSAAAFAVALYDTARGMGEKVAAEGDAVDTVQQLATVAYVDYALKTAADALTGSDKDTANHVRLLGREYGVELLKSLVG